LKNQRILQEKEKRKSEEMTGDSLDIKREKERRYPMLGRERTWIRIRGKYQEMNTQFSFTSSSLHHQFFFYSILSINQPTIHHLTPLFLLLLFFFSSSSPSLFFAKVLSFFMTPNNNNKDTMPISYCFVFFSSPVNDLFFSAFTNDAHII